MSDDDHPEAQAPAAAVDAAAATGAAVAAAAAAAETAAAPDPRAEELRAAVAQFVAGNFAAARQQARALLRGELPAELKQQAEELLRRMGLDPVAIGIAIGSTIFFIVVVVLTFRR
jgi:hypothetical protein